MISGQKRKKGAPVTSPTSPKVRSPFALTIQLPQRRQSAGGTKHLGKRLGFMSSDLLEDDFLFSDFGGLFEYDDFSPRSSQKAAKRQRVWPQPEEKKQQEKRKAAPTWKPKSDVYESTQYYKIVMELPGIKKEDVIVEADEDESIIAIHGTSTNDKRSATEETLSLERSFGEFRRVFQFPEDADMDSIKAKLEEGILVVFIPKEKEGKFIPVE